MTRSNKKTYTVKDLVKATQDMMYDEVSGFLKVSKSKEKKTLNHTEGKKLGLVAQGISYEILKKMGVF